MVIHNDYGKEIIKLTNDKLILNRFIGNTTIARDNIKSINIDEFRITILTKNYKVYLKNISSVLWSEKSLLNQLCDTFQEEKVLFWNKGNEAVNTYYLLTLYFFIFTNGIEGFFPFNLIIMSILVILAIILFCFTNRYNGLIYNIENKVFHKVKGNDKIIATFSISDISSMRECKSYSTAIGKYYKLYVKGKGYAVIDSIQYPLENNLIILVVFWLFFFFLLISFLPITSYLIF